MENCAYLRKNPGYAPVMQTPLGLFVLASGWLARSQWVAYADSFRIICFSQGWLARSQWVAYVIFFFGVICYSQWVACTDPLTLCVLASGWLA